MTSPVSRENRIKSVLSAWTNLRPEKTFAGMTLEEFEQAVGPSFAARDKLKECTNGLVQAQNSRDDADQKSLALIRRVIGAVAADSEEGQDGSLYEAMGFVRDSERATGLTRRSRVRPEPLTAVSARAE